jgi:hypothetical protein
MQIINRDTMKLGREIAENIAKTRYTHLPSVPEKTVRKTTFEILGNLGLYLSLLNPTTIGMAKAVDLVPPNLGSLAPVISKEVGEKAYKLSKLFGDVEPKFSHPY